ncbi:hypothetical protein [Nocardia higoensis]|uniref:hypothetical protein n=1 Tax=Nocardia higoensis TaxID=228599 RepID=UPI0012F65757|nr:hypothetical protein [Nocardia higoensis]
MPEMDVLDKCPLDGPLPDGTCQYVARAERGRWGKLCKKHADRLDKYGDPYATPLPANSKEPTYATIMERRRQGDLNRNAD